MNTKTGNLLIEIGCEELPAKILLGIHKAFRESVFEKLKEAQLSFKAVQMDQFHDISQCYLITPRRIALLIQDISTRQPDQWVRKQGPTRALALDASGTWTKAALGFAASCACDISDLHFEQSDKGERLVFEQSIPGKSLEQLIGPLLNDVLKEIPIGRRMRYSSDTRSQGIPMSTISNLANKMHNFIRPIRWVVLLLDDKAINTEVFGIMSDQYTQGHRFHHPEPLLISKAQDYEMILENPGYVIADFKKRDQYILEKIIETMQELKQKLGYDVAMPIETLNSFSDSKNIISEVTSLTEWPVILIGNFKEEFLTLPEEVLMSAMQIHQKCIPLFNRKTAQLISQFIIVSNIKSTDSEAVAVIRGNENVVNARLADAAFFYETDRKIPLEQYRADLKQVRFQEGLGSLWDKSERISQLAKYIAPGVIIDGHSASPLTCAQAGRYCKSDLQSQMVGEFPELQGTMGRYYALGKQDSKQGFDETVAWAIEEHYYPRFSQDKLPHLPEGCALAIADRADTLVGLFAMGKIPTGNKDPFSLRRQALGLIRLLIEKEMPLTLESVFEYALSLYEQQNILKIDQKEALIQNIFIFCLERLRFFYQEPKFYTWKTPQDIPVDDLETSQMPTPQTVEAVFLRKTNTTLVLDTHYCILALHSFMSYRKPEASVLIAVNKRVKNLLQNNSTATDNSILDLNKLIENAEKKLLDEVLSTEQACNRLLNKNTAAGKTPPQVTTQEEYMQALESLVSLSDPLDQFFKNVMVMSDDMNLRAMRLSLLNRVRNLFLNIADFSVL